MKDVPEAQRDVILAVIEENPALFEKIAKEVKEKTKQGKNETAASMEVMRKYQSELQAVMSKHRPRQ